MELVTTKICMGLLHPEELESENEEKRIARLATK